MISALMILIPLCMVALWVFFRFSSKDKNRMRLVILYNSAVILIAALLCAIFSYRTYMTMINSVDSGWWPILSILGSLFIFSVVLLIGAISRIFIFKKKSGNAP